MKKETFLLVILILLTYSCKKNSIGDCFLSTGKVIEESRNVDFFNKIILKDNVNLHLTQGEKNKLVVKAGENLIKKIITRINKDSCLEITNENRCNWMRSYKNPIDIYLTFTTLSDIEYHSVGNIDNTDTLRLDSLKINVREGAGIIKLCVDTHEFFTHIHRGTATIESFGKTGVSFVYSAGFGLVDNRNLDAGIVYMRTKSSNDVYVRVSYLLTANIGNIGNVYYFGNPSNIEKSGNGNGQIIKLGN